MKLIGILYKKKFGCVVDVSIELLQIEVLHVGFGYVVIVRLDILMEDK